jgi:hypothetical protein
MQNRRQSGASEPAKRQGLGHAAVPFGNAPPFPLPDKAQFCHADETR